jgi:glycosyltransferase involved in cell wall biosynthesis
LKKDKERIDVIFLGRYSESEILNGPEKVAKRIFAEFTKERKAVFIEYFFDGKKYGVIKKLFGKKRVAEINGSAVLRLGLIYILVFLLKSKTGIFHIIIFERFAVIAVILKFFKKCKIIYNVHGIVRYELKHYQEVSSFLYFRNSICEKYFFNYSDKLLFLSGNSIQLAKRYYKIENYKIEIIPNGIDPVFYNPRADIAKPGNEELKLVFIGNINRKEKGFYTVLNILSKVKSSFCLYVISNDKIEMNGNHGHKIIFHDLMAADRLAEFLWDKNIFISFPLHESFSIACTEAMAAGLIPIVSEKVGMSDYILNNQNGFIVEENDAERLNEIIKSLSGNIGLRKNLSQSASNIYNELSWAEVYKKYKRIYDSMLTKS